MLGIKLGYKMPKELTDKVIGNGYDNLSDEEKIALTQLMIKCYPEISKSMYKGFNAENKKEFINEVVEGKFYDRYKELTKAIDSTFNSIVFSAQHSAFKEYFEELFSKKYDSIVVFHASFGWNIDLKQRPQHLAEAMSEENVLYIYRTDAHQDKDVFSVEKVKENLYLVNLDMYSLNVAFFEALETVKKPKFVHVYATCLYDVPYEKIESYINKGFKVIYDFVDEISSDISGVEVSKQMIKDHERLLKDTENVIVVSTAKKLKMLAEEVRGTIDNSILVPNAVNIKDFDVSFVEVPTKMKKITAKGKPIIGYYGALASWFDYNKMIKLAKERPEYEIVLIGINYDKTYDKSGLDNLDNVHYLGIVPYEKLKSYSSCFDVCLVPFIKNDITDSTSPVKIFEYMALGKPIVTTDINECKLYKSCKIAYNDDQFIQEIDYAIRVLANDERYKSILAKEAEENTWSHRAKEIKEAMNNI